MHQEKNAPLAPYQEQTIDELADAFDPHVEDIANIELDDWAEHTAGSPQSVVIRTAGELLRSKRGSCIEMACFQAAAKRHNGADPEARVEVIPAYDGDGERRVGFRAFVRHSDLHRKPERRGGTDDPIHDSRRNECNCTVPQESGEGS
jgi:hypothetical protein